MWHRDAKILWTSLHEWEAYVWVHGLHIRGFIIGGCLGLLVGEVVGRHRPERRRRCYREPHHIHISAM